MSKKNELKLIKQQLSYLLDNLHKLHLELIPVITEYKKKNQNEKT